MKTLFSLIESPFHPDFSALYQKLGIAAERFDSGRKLHQALRCSMSRKGECLDNAVAKSFFGSLKNELVHHADYRTRAEARQCLFEYIELFYNRQRRHATLN